jgi:hypothetical protein
MSRRIDPRGVRRGAAMLISVVLVAASAMLVISLWHSATVARQRGAMELSVDASSAAADSVLMSGSAFISSGQWRALTLPGAVAHVAVDSTSRRVRRVDVGRVGWATLVLRAAAAGVSGVRGVHARSAQRMLIPLVAPMAVPLAAVTGVRPWSVSAGAVVDVSPALGLEARCRDGFVAVGSKEQAFPAAVQMASLPPLLSDTVSGPVVGPVRLQGPALTRALTVIGMVALDTDLIVGAELQVTGVLLVRGAVRRGGGRLDVTGAVIAGDSSGMQSELGAGDRVRYDACAVRRAVEQVTRPGPPASWVHLREF